MMGWKEGSALAKPKARGAAKSSLKGVL